jgi:hypothetical protein
MTGPEHYLEAERLLDLSTADNVVTVLDAQVHATLALAAATAMHPGLYDDWYDVAGPSAKKGRRPA